jgi:uncharacterized protein (TIGR00369 family)
MPVDKRTKQPFGILHGGASITLAETIASLGSAVLVDLKKMKRGELWPQQIILVQFHGVN